LDSGAGSADGSFEGGAILGRELQGVGEQVEGVGAGRTLLTPLQVAHRPRADAGALGQLLLGQAGGAAVAPQKLGER